MNKMSSDRRRYQLRARAERQQQTRARIVAATAELHQEVGPARTTIAEIARRAGVERLTVYNNFPELGDLFAACQAHFLAAHPPPELGPPKPLARGLAELYGWFRANRSMEHHVFRDRALVPELDALLRQTVDRRSAAAAEAYAGGVEPARRLLMVALGFRTWETLAGEGATDAEIARLFADAVACLASAPADETARRGPKAGLAQARRHR